MVVMMRMMWLWHSVSVLGLVGKTIRPHPLYATWLVYQVDAAVVAMAQIDHDAKT